MICVPTTATIQLIGPSVGRSPGLHVSDLYGAMYASLEPNRYGGTDGPNETKMSVGLAWERYLEERLLASGIDAQRPKEFTVIEHGQTIAFSPDLIICDDKVRGGEIKATWMSESDDLGEPKFAKWVTQTKIYGHHLGLPDWRFYVLFINGNYKTHRDPVLRLYDITYTNREMREEWETTIQFGLSAKLLKRK